MRQPQAVYECDARWCRLPATQWRPGGRAYCETHVPRNIELGYFGLPRPVSEERKALVGIGADVFVSRDGREVRRFGERAAIASGSPEFIAAVARWL